MCREQTVALCLLYKDLNHALQFFKYDEIIDTSVSLLMNVSVYDTIKSRTSDALESSV